MRYLNESSNLYDLQSSSNARSNLDVYSTGESDSRYLNESSNLSDLTNASTARSNLGVYSTGDVYTQSQSDGRYLNESSNLSDLTNASTARSNLDVYSKAQTDTSYAKRSNNLSDLDNDATARSNLNVYSKSDVYTKTQADSGFVAKSGDTMTGTLVLDSGPTSDLHAATKQYVDQQISYQEETITLGGDFGSQTVKVVRTGSLITVGATALLTHSLDSGPASDANILPTWAVPSGLVSNCFFSTDDVSNFDEDRLITLEYGHNDKLTLVYSTSNGDPLPSTGSNGAPSMTYLV